MIPVTKSFLPPIEEYQEYLKQVWNNGILTNNGPLLQELEKKIKSYLKVDYFQFLSNGTIALQLAINALDIEDAEIITTPFSFVATTTSILWEKCKPVFVDINKDTLCIDETKIEEKITEKTKAIMAVHVYGYPCNVEKIEQIAKKHNLKVIYDGAHAFGCEYKGKSLLNFGDITTCSFHATKLFHTVEGGACIANSKEIDKKIDFAKKFGFESDNYESCGINAKNSEVHSAMGLANLKYISKIIEDRKNISELYDELLKNVLIRPYVPKDFKYNYIYYPVIFESESQLLNVKEMLENKNIFIRRYFYPSLNKLKYLETYDPCPISEDISKRIACLPLYVGLTNEEIIEICDIIKATIKN